MAEEVVLTGSTSRDYGRAALVVVAVLFFYALLLLTDLPAVLPGYPAVIVSFLIWCDGRIVKQAPSPGQTWRAP